ncbi:MAG: cytochrome c oxidase subunit I, partial [Chloroflexi bacterium]|nr:cytochrome c oxidase subunit I [Chloroflexota bacterium]
ASYQPYVFAAGMLLVSIGMIAAGLQGVSRRHWDITFAGAPFSTDVPGTAQLMLAIAGIGALVAVVGGLMYLLVVLASVFTGKQMEANRLTLVMNQANPLVEDALPNVGKEIEGKHTPKGTMAIVLAFLTFFIVYYFSNWWLLGRAWIIR